MVIGRLLAQTTQDGVSMETFGWGTLAFGVAGALGLVAWVVSVLRRSGRTTGTVIGHAYVPGEDGHSYARMVEFHLDGTRYEFQDKSSSNPARGQVGDQVSVSYRPSRPDKANIGSSGRVVGRAIGWVSLTVLFGGMIALGILMIAEASESAVG